MPRKAEADLRSELAASGSRSNPAVDRQLAAAIDERNKLQREIGTMKRDAESTWATERVENALLRERINDVAAEVARLTAALEGLARRSNPCWSRGRAKRAAPA